MMSHMNVNNSAKAKKGRAPTAQEEDFDDPFEDNSDQDEAPSENDNAEQDVAPLSEQAELLRHETKLAVEQATTNLNAPKMTTAKDSSAKTTADALAFKAFAEKLKVLSPNNPGPVTSTPIKAGEGKSTPNKKYDWCFITIEEDELNDLKLRRPLSEKVIDAGINSLDYEPTPNPVQATFVTLAYDTTEFPRSQRFLIKAMFQPDPAHPSEGQFYLAVMDKQKAHIYILDSRRHPKPHKLKELIEAFAGSSKLKGFGDFHLVFLKCHHQSDSASSGLHTLRFAQQIFQSIKDKKDVDVGAEYGFKNFSNMLCFRDSIIDAFEKGTGTMSIGFTKELAQPNFWAAAGSTSANSASEIAKLLNSSYSAWKDQCPKDPRVNPSSSSNTDPRSNPSSSSNKDPRDKPSSSGQTDPQTKPENSGSRKRAVACEQKEIMNIEQTTQQFKASMTLKGQGPSLKPPSPKRPGAILFEEEKSDEDCYTSYQHDGKGEGKR